MTLFKKCAIIKVWDEIPISAPTRRTVAPEREVITMVTYEGIFTFIIMLTGVIALVFDIIKFFKDK